MVDYEFSLRDYSLTRITRNEFVKYFFQILIEEYFVDYAKVSRAIGRDKVNIYNWLRGYNNKMLSEQVLDDIELFMAEKYYPILQNEIVKHQPFVDTIKEKSNKELEETLSTDNSK